MRLTPTPGDITGVSPRSITAFLASKRLVAAIWIAIVILAAVRCYAPIHYDSKLTALQSPEAIRTGYFLYKDGDWLNPFRPYPTGPTAHLSPGFPALVAVMYHIFGTGAAGVYLLTMLEATVIVAQIALIPLVSRALGAGLRTGLIAAFFAIFGIRRAWYWEGNYVAFLLILATLLACRYYGAIRDGGQANTREGVAALLRSPVRIALILGVVWGITILTGGSTASVWLVWLLLGIWLSGKHGPRYAWAPVLIVPLLMSAPWVWRNYKELHSFIPLRSDLGLELSVSNNDCAAFGIIANRKSGCYEALHPNISVAQAKRVAALGEVRYNRMRKREALAWISAHPGRAVHLWLERFFYFWFPSDTGNLIESIADPETRMSAPVIYLMTLLSIPGLLLLAQANRAGAVLCITFLAVYPVIYYFLQFEGRYRFPILWVTFVLGAVAIRELARVWLAGLASLRSSRFVHLRHIKTAGWN